MAVTNTPAYYNKTAIMAFESLIVEAPGKAYQGQILKLIWPIYNYGEERFNDSIGPWGQCY